MQINRGRDSIIDIEYLTQLQDSFSRAVGVYSYCLDTAGIPVTEINGPEDEVERLTEYITPETVADVFYRLTVSSLEDQAIEDTSVPNIKLGLTTVRVNGQPLLTWVIAGVISDADSDGYSLDPVTGFSRTVAYDRFQDALDLIRETCLYQASVRMSAVNAEAENRRNRYSEAELGEALKRAEVMTSIVQLMDRDDVAESIAVSALKTVGEYLGLSSAHIYITNIQNIGLIIFY